MGAQVNHRIRRGAPFALHLGTAAHPFRPAGVAWAMNSTHVRNPVLLASFLALAALTSACGGGTPGSAEAPSALSSALEASTAASGTLLCAPADAQVAACASKAAGDACELTPPDGAPAVAGTCRTTIDGATVGCAPNPPAPPRELVEACADKVASATCQVAEAFGNSRDGVCVTARDGATLVCGRVRVPPQGAVDACASLAAGDSCTMAGQGAMGTGSGVCSLGPASTGPLACAPQKDLLPNGEQACAGLSAGATCTLGRRHETVSGTCVAPAAGTATVCVVACADLRGRFTCDPGAHRRR